MDNQLIDIVSEQVDRIASMAAIADIEYNVFCAELLLKAVTTVVKHVEPFPDPFEDVTAPDPIPWEEIEQKRDPCYTTYKQMHVTQIIKHIVGMMDKRPGHKQVIKQAVDSFFLHLRVYKYSTFLDCIVNDKLKQRFDHDLYKEIERIHYSPWDEPLERPRAPKRKPKVVLHIWAAICLAMFLTANCLHIICQTITSRELSPPYQPLP